MTTTTPAADHRPRHRLPRRHPRDLHGRARLRGARRRHRPSARSTRCRRRGAVLRARPARDAPARPWTSGRLRFTTDLAEAGEFGDVHFICVGTPQQPGSHAADLTYVERRGPATSRRTCDRRCLVVGKSTVPVGTAARLTQIVPGHRPGRGRGRAGLEPGVPARGLRGRGHDAPGPAGLRRRRREWARGAAARPRSRRCWTQGAPVVVTDLPTAELVKVAANSFLATKISYINAMAEVCEATGADVQRPGRGAGVRRRGSAGRFLQPGPRLRRRLPAQGHPGLHAPGRGARRRAGRSRSCARSTPSTSGAASAPSTWSASRPAATLAGVKVCALGAAFKPNSDDIRDAPALDVARMLQEEGAIVQRLRPGGDGQRPPGLPRPALRRRGLQAAADCRRGRAADRVGPVPRDRSGPPRRGRRGAGDRRRPARAGRHCLARGRLDLPRAGAGSVATTHGGLDPTPSRSTPRAGFRSGSTQETGSPGTRSTGCPLPARPASSLRTEEILVE